MAYLVIMVLVAVAGITRLWLQQRRERAQLQSIEGFNIALEKISPENSLPIPKSRQRRRPWFRRRLLRTAVVPRRPARPRRRPRPTGRKPGAEGRRPDRRRRARPVAASQDVRSLDPSRRKAARARIEARRRARARAAG